MTSAPEAHIHPLPGMLFALGATICFATNAVTAKYGLSREGGFGYGTFALIWGAAAAAYALAFVIASGQTRRLAVPRHTFLRLAGIGLSTGLCMVFSWSGLTLLEPTFFAFVYRFAPVMTIGLSAVFLGERLSPMEFGAAALMVLGGFICKAGEWHVAWQGVALTLLGCLAAAFTGLLAKKTVADLPAAVMGFYRNLIGALVIVPYTFLSGNADFSVAPSIWAVTLTGAFLGPCLGQILLFRSYGHWQLSRSTMVRQVGPLFVLPLAYVFLRNLPTGRELVGGAVILAGAFWFLWIHFRRMGAAERGRPRVLTD